MSPRSDLRDLLRSRLAELTKLQLSRVVPDVHAVEGQRIEVHIQPECAVRPLHKRERADLRIPDRAQTEVALGSPPQRAPERADERAEDGG